MAKAKVKKWKAYCSRCGMYLGSCYSREEPGKLWPHSNCPFAPGEYWTVATFEVEEEEIEIPEDEELVAYGGDCEGSYFAFRKKPSKLLEELERLQKRIELLKERVKAME